MIRFRILSICMFALVLSTQAQRAVHSHNDYEQDVPFWKAFASGARSIEVDLFLRDGQLYAAHEEAHIDAGRTLESLYLKPLQEARRQGFYKGGKLQLLIDIKTEAYATLDQIVADLSRYQDLFAADAAFQVVPVISGNRPAPQDYTRYPSYVLFDYQSLKGFDQVPMERVALVSMSFQAFSDWNGKGRIVAEQMQKLEKAIEAVHTLGKPIRFWATPDTKSAWYTMNRLGVDFINTDHPFEAVDYLRTLPERTYASAGDHTIYQPAFAVDGKQKKVKNVILIIGDGMGLAHISAGLYGGSSDLTLTQLHHIGFSKTQSADDFTTDSAAGGTAMATGQKTRNRAIGVSPDFAPVQNLPERLSQKGMIAGIVTTDELTGATPAAFYAHQPDRGMEDQIAKDLLQSPASLFIGGGKQRFEQAGVWPQLLENGFTTVSDLPAVAEATDQKLIFFAAERSIPSKVHGRTDYLPEATDAALQFLSKKKKPFFLLLEGAYIDSGGHENNLAMVVEEMLDLDLAIARALKFADENGETLVIITADHETGGLTIPQGDMSRHLIEGQFFSNDHTGIMVPVFAYGPQSGEFSGVYENTAIFEKILKVTSGR